MVTSQSNSSLDPVLATLSLEDINVLDDIIAKAPNATAFTTIFKAYSEVLKQKGLDPGEDVIHYKRLLKLGVIKGADWGTKWEIVRSQLPAANARPTSTQVPPKASSSISSLPLEPDDVFLSTKLSDSTTITQVSSNNSSFPGIKTPNLKALKHPTRHKVSSDSEFSTLPGEEVRRIGGPFSDRPNRLHTSGIQTPIKHVSRSPKKVYPVNDKETWKKIEETRFVQDADHFRRQSLLSTCLQTWRRGLEWIHTTHQQIDEARTSIQLRIYFGRWRSRSLAHKQQIREAVGYNNKRILYLALHHWYKSLSKRRVRKFNEELNLKVCDFQRRCQQRTCRNAWMKWRQLHLAERFHVYHLSLQTFRQWLVTLRNLDRLEILADQFEESQDQRMLKKAFDLWYRLSCLKDMEVYMAKRSSSRVLQQAFAYLLHRAQENKNAKSIYKKNLLKRSLHFWQRTISNKQALELRGDKYINRCNIVLIRAVMHVWVARERGQLLLRVRDMRILQTSLTVWQHQFQAKRVMQELSMQFAQRVSAQFLKAFLARWQQKLEFYQTQEALAKERYLCTLAYNALLLWRLRLREHVSLFRTAKIARRYFVEKSAWSKWRTGLEAVRRKKKLQRIELAYLNKFLTKWKATYHRCKQEKGLLATYEKQAQQRILNKYMELWTNRTILIKLREMDMGDRYNKQLLSDVLSKWKEARSRQLENLSLVRSYLDVKREESLRRTFTTWLTTARRERTRRMRLAEREEELRLDILTMAWERWRDRFCENCLREAELGVIIRNQQNILHHAFSSWLSRCNSIPGIRLYATNLKLKMWSKWREALPQAIRANKAEEVHTRKLLRNIFDMWKEAYRTKIALKAVTRARHLRLPTPGYRASTDERDPLVIKPSIRRPLRSLPPVTPPERTPAPIVLLSNRYKEKQSSINVSPSRSPVKLMSGATGSNPSEDRQRPAEVKNDNEDNVRALLWTKLRNAQAARHMK